MKKIVYSCLLVATLGCTEKFDDMNLDPNNPVNIGPQYLLPYATERSIDRYWGGNIRFERLNLDGTMLWMQYLSRNIYSSEGDNYGITPTFYNNTWKSFYNDGLVNFQRIITQSKPDGPSPHTNYEGIALVMRSWVFSLLTDLYGPIPYQEAIQGSAETPIFNPAYNTQDEVYAGILADLKVANEKLVVGGPAVSGDILYQGNILRWKKLANSLRIRLANRQAAKKPAESRAILREIMSDPTKFPIFTSVADNAALTHSEVRPSNNEWHEVMIWGGRTDWNLSKTLVDRLQSLQDPRLAVYGNPVGGRFEGIPNGLPDAIATTFLSSAATLGNYFTRAATPSVVMTYSELLFTLAEAALDGDISTGSAQSYYEQGIQASMAQYNLTMPSGYLATAGPATKESIMLQKWIALFGQGVEAWAEYRRTGLPAMPTRDARAVFENDGVLPTRLPYPTTEYSLNKAKMDVGVKILGQDNMKAPLWWVE